MKRRDKFPRNKILICSNLIGFEKEGGMLRKRKEELCSKNRWKKDRRKGGIINWKKEEDAEMRTDVCLLCATFSA